jgi:hypothetical protein
MQVLADPAPSTHRAGLRVRAFMARHGQAPVIVHALRRPQRPEHARYFNRYLAVFAIDANKSLRRPAEPDSS